MKPVFNLRPIVIPAGTMFSDAPGNINHIATGSVLSTIGLSKNTSGSVIYFVGEPGSAERNQLEEIFSEFPDPRPPHIVRVEHEALGLNDLFSKLRDLLSTPSRLEQFGLLGTQEHERLLAQSFFMEGYLTTLRDRLDAAEGRSNLPDNPDIPRRVDRNRMTEHELVLTAVMHYLEATPGNTRFTTALTCVSEARAQLADLADGVPLPEPSPTGNPSYAVSHLRALLENLITNRDIALKETRAIDYEHAVNQIADIESALAILEPAPAPKPHGCFDATKKGEAAKVLYELYCEAVGGKAFNGDPLPSWHEFSTDPGKTKQATAWIMVGAKAVNELGMEVNFGTVQDVAKIPYREVLKTVTSLLDGALEDLVGEGPISTPADAAPLTRGAATAKAKSLRKALDEVLQEAKDHLSAMKLLPDYGDDTSEAIAQHIISIRELESAIMRQGMVLKAIGVTNPYPESKNPDSPVIEPTADGLKL